ncbi:MAG: hypothetical protein F9B45_25765 [Phycisphaera sp. RhM]|nr:hypothetical protein [Phycisphaera sp. RhM]
MLARWTGIALVVAAIHLIGASHSTAGVMVSGDAALLAAAPPSVFADSLESNDVAWVFAERKNFLLLSDLDVNVLSPGRIFGNALESVFNLSSQRVNSFFVSFDPVGRPGGLDPFWTANGALRFETPILGIITADRQLYDSENLGLRSTTTIYPIEGVSTGARGMDATDLSFDFVEISADRLTVSFGMAARFPSDQFRVITAAPVPEPAGSVIFGLGALCIAGIRTRRRVNAL